MQRSMVNLVLVIGLWIGLTGVGFANQEMTVDLPGGATMDFVRIEPGMAFVTFLVESGATAREAQTLARHSTPDLTMNIYAKTRDERLAEAVEKIGGNLLAKEECVPGVYRLVVGQN